MTDPYWRGVKAPPTNGNQEDLERYARNNARRMLVLLWDLEWHPSWECVKVAGHRFGSPIHILRDSGWDIETHCTEACTDSELIDSEYPVGTYLYRLVSHDQGKMRQHKVRVYAPHEDVLALANGKATPGMIEAARIALGMCDEKAA